MLAVVVANNTDGLLFPGVPSYNKTHCMLSTYLFPLIIPLSIYLLAFIIK